MRKNLDFGRFCIIFVARERILKVHRRVCVMCSKDPQQTRDTPPMYPRRALGKTVISLWNVCVWQDLICLTGYLMSDDGRVRVIVR